MFEVIDLKKYLLSLAIAVVACSPVPEDEYLASLNKLPHKTIKPIRSIDLEQYGLMSPTGFVKVSDWFAVADHADKYAIALIGSKDGECHRFIPKGRGPGEMVSPDLSVYGNRLVLYDVSSSRIAVSLDADKTVETGMPVMDTIGDFSKMAMPPIKLQYCRDGLISSFPSDRKIWYALRNTEGRLLSSVEVPHYAELAQIDENLFGSFISSSHYTVHPEGNRVCCSLVGAAALSFAEIKNSALREYRRYEMLPPATERKGEKTVFSRKKKTAFSAPVSDKENVYVLYSGRTRESEDGIPQWEKNHLIVYSWDGKAQRHFILSENAMAIWVEDGLAYCLSTYPTGRIMVYKLFD